jgi:protein-disulfide isomerase
VNSLTPQASVLIGSVLISLSILVHGGIIKIGKADSVATPPPAAAPAGGQAAKTDAQRMEGLKKIAADLKLDTNKFNSCLDSGDKASAVSADLADGSTAGVGGTPSFFVNGRELFIGASPFAEFKKVIDEELNGTAPATVTRKTVGVGNLPPRGNLNAPVTFIEFSDYECPFCSRFYTDAEQQIMKEYVNTGKVKFYYRDYPLTSIHPGAQKAAEAARCAGDQNKYWEYHDLVFTNQAAIF